MSENENIHNEEVRLYELGINLVSSLEDKTQSEFEAIKEIIKKNGGEIVSESTPVAIPLAYTMLKNIDSKNQKHNNASFGWVKFNTTPDKITLIKEELDLNVSILRYMILLTTNTSSTSAEEVAEALSKKSEAEDKKKKRSKDAVEAEEVEVSEEVESDTTETEDAVDEAIEELVSEE